MSSDAVCWSCSTCTYQHETPKERQFLSCAMCSSPRSMQPAPATTCPTSSLSSSDRSHPKKKQKLSRQGKLSEHFGSVKNNAPTSTERTNKPAITQTATLQQPKDKATNQDIAAEEGPHHHKRSILEVLKPRPSSSFVPCARYRNHPKDPWREIACDKDLPKFGPLTFIRDVLPPQLSTRLLEQLERESQTWNRGNWIVHGKNHAIPRTSATYNVSSDSNSCSSGKNGLSEEHDDEYRDHVPRRQVSDELKEATICIQEIVQKHCPWAKTTKDPSSDAFCHWEPTFAFANRYQNGDECVGWHSDHIMKLGPRPIIAGLTLGACRRFELRQHQTPSTHNHPQSDKSQNKYHKVLPQQQPQGCRHISVSLPHNSLVIMWNDAQESWQHSVPRCSNDSILMHSQVGLVRISLTFRMERHVPNFGVCYCGRPVGLKAKEGRYYTFCVPYGESKSKTCNYWKPCPWAEEEARRLARLEGAADR